MLAAAVAAGWRAPVVSRVRSGRKEGMSEEKLGGRHARAGKRGEKKKKTENRRDVAGRARASRMGVASSGRE